MFGYRMDRSCILSVLRPVRFRHVRSGRSGLSGIALGILALLFGACQGSELAPPDVVAELAGGQVRYIEFEQYVDTLGGDAEAVYGSDVLSGLFDEYLRELCLIRYAFEEQLVEEGASARRAARALLENDPVSLPDRQEVREYFERNRERFVQPERLHIRQILVHERAEADAARARLQRGEAFEDVARSSSADPSAEWGGDQGWLAYEDLPPAFAETIAELEVGAVSDIVEAEYGFHLFMLDERQEATDDLAAVELEVTRIFDDERQRQRLEELVAESLARYNVRVFERNLPFNYQGAFLENGDP